MLKFSYCVIRFGVRTIILWPLTILHAYCYVSVLLYLNQNVVLIRYCIYQVFSFGSVPLKTYLPDGDVDLTVLTPRDKEDEFAKALLRMLEAKVGDSDFQITSVQYVPAQVCFVPFWF